MADLRPDATPVEILADLLDRLSPVQDWLEDQQLKAKDRMECLNRLADDPFLSKHVTDKPQLLKQKTAQMALFTILDSVRTKLGRTVDFTNYDIPDLVKDLLTPENIAPSIETPGELQTDTVIKSEDENHPATNVPKSPVECVEDAERSSDGAQATPRRPPSQMRRIRKNHITTFERTSNLRTVTAASALDLPTVKPKRGLDHEHSGPPTKRFRASQLEMVATLGLESPCGSEDSDAGCGNSEESFFSDSFGESVAGEEESLSP